MVSCRKVGLLAAIVAVVVFQHTSVSMQAPHPLTGTWTAHPDENMERAAAQRVG